MKNNSFQLLFVLLIISINISCSKCEMIFFGMKMPHLETRASLTKYMNQHQMDSSTTLVAKDTVMFEKLYNYLAGQAPILIFNKDGYLNIYADKRYCAGPVENYVGKICTATALGVDSTKTEKELRSLVVAFSVLPAEVLSVHPDYSVYLTWTKWKNKTNESIFRWRDLIEKQNNCKINIHFINLDQRAEHYGFTHRKRICVEAHGHRNTGK